MSTITEATAFPVAALLFPRANDAAVAYTKSVVTAMTGNDDFKPAPQELATLATDADAFDKANVAARGGGTVATKALKAARKQVVKDLNHIRNHIQAAAEAKATAEDAARVIVGAGLQIER